ncbi:PilX N-terminal domain-containing pilus assembly protein [Pontibacterium sp.]|uniref:pilus assembly PilX family protein n=1 Tax=Pontibacterium sp. TaxID=2036026 RepID=UPI003516A67B
MSRAAQKGSVLIIAMVLLLVMTLIGMAGIEVTGLEERMVLNMRDRQAAFEAAEAALAQAEEFLDADSNSVSLVNFADQDGTGGFYDAGGNDSCNDKSDDSEGDEEESESKDASGSEDSNDNKPLWQKEWGDDCVITFSKSDDAFAQLANTPEYIIERLYESDLTDSLSKGSGDNLESHVYYRITVMAKGLTETTEVRLQTVYKVKR